ncbi:MAG: histidine kinase [Hydrogenophaga sp.]|uniref:helix-turn-helix domain-containing protein n=1 Tax=Hydrogenophaga sp. TaxID=1904254 RepID=UPI001D421B57|nr:helix-turn-helix domain-containing protein [Hydrogenophaga sp.]MBX3611355.1 histidine kinase [Hydrogenophaga sp.]
MSTSPHAATAERLALIEQARRAVLDAREPEASPRLSPWVARSWQRCLQLGLEHHREVAFEPVSDAQMRRALEASEPLLQAASPVIRSLSRAMAHTHYFAILTDAQGVVIDVNGPVDRHEPGVSGIARLGVDLSERAVGTTAIGMALTDLQPVWLHRGEHFFDATGVYSCAGAPIWDPDGHCVGMLDLTGVNVSEQPALKHLVSQSARSIENALALARPHHLLLRMNWPGRVLGDDSDGLVCLDGDGDITGMNRPAADMLGVSPGVPAGHASLHFAAPIEGLFDAAAAHRGGQEVPLWSGLRLQVLAQFERRNARSAPATQGVPLKDLETALIRKAVDDARGNVKEAASALGISRATIYRKLGARRR